EDAPEDQVVEVRELIVEPAFVRLRVRQSHGSPLVSSAARTLKRPGRRPPIANAHSEVPLRSCGGGPSQLPLEGSDIPLAEAPLPAPLEGAQDVFSRRPLTPPRP